MADQQLESVLEAISNICKTAKDIIASAQSDFDENPEDFVSKKISKLFPLAQAYKQAFEKTKAICREEFEQKIKELFSDRNVRDAFEELTEVENEWNQFLLKVDEKCSGQTISEVIETGGQAPSCQGWVDVPTGNPTSLDQQLAKASGQSGQTYLVLVLLRHFA